MLYALLMSFAFAKEIRVGIVDTGVALVSPISSHYSGPYDIVTNVHGTQVASLIVYGDLDKPFPVCDEVKIYSCNFMLGGVAGCLKQFKGFDYINMSLEGPNENAEERKLIKEYIRAGTVITVAAGNSGVDIQKTKAYPASYMYDPGMNGNYQVVSGGKYNFGKGVIYVNAHALSLLPDGRIGSIFGSSAASAIHLHATLLERCRLN